MSLPETNPDFEALLDHLKHKHGCDLTIYKRSPLMRRFDYRMQNLNIDSYQNYLQYLQNHSTEYLALLDDVLINVTGFFRDTDAWSYLADEVIPKMIASKQPDEPIRIWSAGCATGQEIYSLLILLAETIGVESCLKRAQCYATDIDEAAIAQARKGIYSALETSSIPHELLEKYFEKTEQGYAFRLGLRRTIIFGLHDLSKNAPMSRIDLLLCRNVMIYFNPETQASTLIRFHFALRNTGFLFLGRSETLINRRRIFIPIHTKHRIYAKGLDLELADHLSISPKSHKQLSVTPSIQSYFWQTAFESSPIAQFAVDLNGCLIGANDQANLLFGLTLNDYNRPFQDLEPGKLIASHTLTNAIYYNHRPLLLKDIQWPALQRMQYFDVAIAPVLNGKKQLIGKIVTFIDKTGYQQLTEQIKYTSTELEEVSEALQTTQTELESTHQEIRLLEQHTHYEND